MGSQAFPSFAWWIDERFWAYPERGELQTELELFLHEGSQAVEEITLRRFSVHPKRASALTGLAQSLE